MLPSQLFSRFLRMRTLLEQGVQGDYDSEEGLYQVKQTGADLTAFSYENNRLVASLTKQGDEFVQADIHVGGTAAETGSLVGALAGEMHIYRSNLVEEALGRGALVDSPGIGEFNMRLQIPGVVGPAEAVISIIRYKGDIYGAAGKIAWLVDHYTRAAAENP